MPFAKGAKGTPTYFSALPGALSIMSMDKFSITSSSSNEKFIFSKREGEFFNFEIVGESVQR
tara:strand:- start:197 stop:382 length:186 start_codon:yes stop_codon:yes gene_type:complete